MKKKGINSPLSQGLEKGSIPTISLAGLERLCITIIHSNFQIKAAAELLEATIGAQLEFRGLPYPLAEGEPYDVARFVKLMTLMLEYKGPVKVVP